MGGGGCWLGPATLRLAEAVSPFPPSVEVTALVTLFLAPVLVPETFTAKLHAALAASVAPERLTLADPAAAVMAPPPQLPVKPLGVATTRPAGKESVKPIPDKEALALGFVMVNVNDVAPFKVTLTAPNCFVIAGGEVRGGGGGPPDEPPPHAEAHKRPKIMAIQHKRQRGCVDTFPLIPREWPDGHLPRAWGVHYPNN